MPKGQNYASAASRRRARSESPPHPLQHSTVHPAYAGTVASETEYRLVLIAPATNRISQNSINHKSHSRIRSERHAANVAPTPPAVDAAGKAHKPCSPPSHLDSQKEASAHRAALRSAHESHAPPYRAPIRPTLHRIETPYPASHTPPSSHPCLRVKSIMQAILHGRSQRDNSIRARRCRRAPASRNNQAHH